MRARRRRGWLAALVWPPSQASASVWEREATMRVGFIGLGNMGEPLAGFVSKAGFPLVVHDLRQEAAATLLASGATWATSPREVAVQCDVICVCVPGPPQMQAVTVGAGGIVEGVRADAVVIDH